MCACGFRVGDIVILKYPHKDEWGDLSRGISQGCVVPNAKHIINSIVHKKNSKSCAVRVEGKSLERRGDWGCNAAVWEKFTGVKRNLPTWW